MNTLRQAVQEYLSLRRGLGFKLQAAGVNLRPNRASDLRPNGASSKCRFRDLEQG
jgi:hypothetical protein